MNTELGQCEVCEVNEAKHVMFPTGGRIEGPTRMCDDCAREAFESGEYESDEN